MERRVLIALFLSFLVVFAYQSFFPPAKPKPQPQQGTTSETSATAGQSQASGNAAGASTANAALAAELVVAGQEETTTFDLANVVAVFTNRGGRLKSWKLKKYRDPSGQPLELIDSEIQTLPFSLTAADSTTTRTLNAALFTSRRSPDNGAERLVFEFRGDNGLVAIKQFDLDSKGYTVSVRAQVSQNGQALPVAVAWGPGLGDRDPQAVPSTVKPEAIFSSANSVSRLAASKIQSQPVYDQEFDYAGIDDHYFAAFVAEAGTSQGHLRGSDASRLAKPADPGHDRMAFSVEPATRRAGSSPSTSARKTSTRSPQSIATSSRRSTSACSPSSSFRCCAR